MSNLGSFWSTFLHVDGTTDDGMEVKKAPYPFKLPQEALKKYLLPCVSSTVQLGVDISNISFSPVIIEKSALVDHCTKKSEMS